MSNVKVIPSYQGVVFEPAVILSSMDLARQYVYDLVEVDHQIDRLILLEWQENGETRRKWLGPDGESYFNEIATV